MNNVYVMTRTANNKTELLRIDNKGTDLFIDGVYQKTKPTLFGNAQKSAKAHYKAGYRFILQMNLPLIYGKEGQLYGRSF